MAVGRTNQVRIVLDTATAISLIMLMDLQITGLFLHESAGLVLYGLFILHKYINRKWIIGVSRAAFGRLPMKTRLNYLLDVLMFTGFTLLIISGAMISRTIAWLPGDGVHEWKTIHVASGLAVFVLAAVHVGLHFRFIVKSARKGWDKLVQRLSMSPVKAADPENAAPAENKEKGDQHDVRA